MIDLRSDTVTVPCSGMRQAMMTAIVGDDVIDIDPTVQQLQERIAELLGKEAAIFMPSGTMTNQVAVRLHCQRGDEFLCEYGCHIFTYEQAAFASMSGVAAHPLVGSRGNVTLNQLVAARRPDNEHAARTTLVCLEHTHNRAGGKLLDWAEVLKIASWCRANSLRLHLDGARLFNAAVATQKSLAELAEPFDTVSVCFSKGLGAPVGSALVGSRESIAQARRHRKAFGGGMRQSGILAAAALYALEHNFERLADDHANATWLAEAIQNMPGLQIVDPEPNRLVDTNIVLFSVAPELGTAPEFAAKLNDAGVRCFPFSATSIRFVTHLHITRDDVASVAKTLGSVLKTV
ncbi:MAG: low-specificity L-threonine aldolase [Planctomycetaceae bacterium]|nr:low-specificity L-threonine aldolase [Planctomycetaceae bacterium]